MRAAGAALLLTLALAGAAVEPTAGEAPGVADFRAGAAAFAAGNHAEAERRLDAAALAMPGQGDVLALRGMARYHLGRLREADRDLFAALGADTRYASRARYYRGLVRTALGDARGAEEAFAVLLARHPDSPEAERVRAVIAKRRPDPVSPSDPVDTAAAIAPAPPTARLWSASLLVGGYHDENPTSASYDLAATQTFPADQMLLVYGQASVAVPRTPLRVGLDVLRVDYRETADLDFSSVGGSAELRLQPRPLLWITPRWTHTEQWLEDAFYGRSDRGEVALEQRFAPFAVICTPWVQRARYVERYSGYDGDEIGVRLRGRWDGRGMLRQLALQGAWDDSDADDRWLGWTEAELAGSLRADLVWRSSLDLRGAWRWRWYDAIAPGDPQERYERRWSWSATISRPLWWDRLLLQASYEFTWNDADLDRYAYDKQVIGLALLAWY